MTKSEAIALFGSNNALAAALGISAAATSQWGQELTQRQQDMVIGAAVRLGKIRARKKTKDRTTADDNKGGAGKQTKADPKADGKSTETVAGDAA